MTAKSPTHKTGDGAYNNGACVVHDFELLTGVTTASGVSKVLTMPFDAKVKQVDFDITDAPAATGNVTLRKNGTAIAAKNMAGLATGIQGFAPSDFTTTFIADNYQLRRGDRVTVTIDNVASFAGRPTVVFNPQ